MSKYNLDSLSMQYHWKTVLEHKYEQGRWADQEIEDLVVSSILDFQNVRNNIKVGYYFYILELWLNVKKKYQPQHQEELYLFEVRTSPYLWSQ